MADAGEHEAEGFARFLTEILDVVPYSQRLGLTVEMIERHHVVMRMPHDPGLENGMGVVHGGAIASLIDAAGTASFWATDTLPDNPRGATVSLSISYLAAARSGVLTATAKVIKSGRTISVGEIWVTDEKETLIAKASITYMLTGG